MESANWNCLPTEIKCMIIGFMDTPTRISLKHCSHLDKELVDSFPLKVLHGCNIVGDVGMRQLYIYSSKPVENWNKGWDTEIKFQQVEELDEYFQCKIYNHYDKIEKCFIKSKFDYGGSRQSFLNTFKFSHSKYNIRIADLYMDNAIIKETMMLLKQVDQNFLEKLVINTKKFVSKLYDIPQVINAKHLVIWSNSMTRKQLWKLKASHLQLYCSEHLTAKDLNIYLKKRLSEVCEDTWYVHIHFKKEEPDEETICEGLIVEDTGRISDSDGLPVKRIQSSSSQFQFELQIFRYWVTVQKKKISPIILE